jgi:putative ABC transport system permease protein
MIVNGQTFTIVGVAPEGFQGTTLGSQPAIFVPITMRGVLQPTFKGYAERKAYWIYAFGRLRPGVTIAQAASQLNARYRAIINEVEVPLQAGMSTKDLARFKAKEVLLTPGSQGQSRMHREATTPLRLLLAVTALVLIIACANVANLLLARSAARAAEMAVRLSIGASRMRLVTQLLVEAILLALMGGVAGLLVARLTLAVIMSLIPNGSSLIAIDFRVLEFALAVSCVTGVLFGLFPAWHSTRPDLASILKGVSGQPSGNRRAALFRRSLVTVQITLSLALLGCAGLFIRSLDHVSRTELGLNVDHLVMFAVSPRLNGYTPDRSRMLFAQMEEDLRSAPGVTAVGASALQLLAGDDWGKSVSVEGFPRDPNLDHDALFNEVGPGYFHTLGIPVLAGREFTIQDVLQSQKTAIVNEAFAKKFNLGRNVVGKRMAQSMGTDAKLDIEIVGLVKDAKYDEVKRPVPPVFVRPYRQDDAIGNMTFYVRTSIDARQFLATIPTLVHRFDPNLPIENLRTMPDQVRRNMSLDRTISTLAAAFAVLATVLAAIGLYGVLAYSVTQRTREFGLRMALGADARRVRRLVLRQVGAMTAVGIAAGLPLALLIGHFAESLLFQMKGSDPLVLGAATTLLATVALMAGLPPAVRASRLQPMAALRQE